MRKPIKKIAVIGSINVDIVFQTNELPKRGETIFSHGFETHFGGKGANQAFTAGRLGGDVTFFGSVGNDNYGVDSLNNLSEEGNVAINYIRKSDDEQTGLANIVVANDGSNQIIVHSGANFHFPNDYIETIKSALEPYDIVIFQLEIPINVVEELAHFAHNAEKTVILNPAPAAPLANYKSDRLLEAVDYLIPNETELALLSGLPVTSETDALEAAKQLLKDYPIPHLIVTLGSMGAYYINHKEQIKIPAQTVTAVDTTCAGDSYIGAFSLKLSQGETIIDALTFATQVSAVVVTRKGAQSSIPTLEEINNYSCMN